jgi:gamma-glutamylaminecyclotransferase|tara:strand:+ start:44639 stop:45109 length:471 start_codon:yes stop_codon:yes gene_type:complete
LDYRPQNADTANYAAVTGGDVFLRVFVYGTLLAGESNHAWLKGASCLGRWTTPPRFTLIDLGPYPVLSAGGRTAVTGEVYRISRLILQRLDVLEGYPADYQRRLIDTPWGRAWVYLRASAPAGRPLHHGDWRRRPLAHRAFYPLRGKQIGTGSHTE